MHTPFPNPFLLRPSFPLPHSLFHSHPQHINSYNLCQSIIYLSAVMSTRRIKDRGGGDGGAATLRPTRSVTPLSAPRKLSSSSSTEKENHPQLQRSTSRGSGPNPAQKPAIRPVPRIDKTTAAKATSTASVHGRRSASSVPRGRSSSPSEFPRASTDSLKTRRVSVDRVTKDPSREARETRERKPNQNSSEKVKVSIEEKSRKVSILKDGSSSNSSSKYTSRLHEKLAFLEGKVQRIASDIKKTKEMLDLNNPDASKVILSEIQDKISGIEKAMVNVTGADSNSSKQIGLVVKSGGDDDVKGSKLGEANESLIKGLNTDDLEARLFPHHRLIRDRTLMKESLPQSGLGNESNAVKPKVEDDDSSNNNNVLSNVDENSIAMEFLSLLSDKEINKDAGGAIGCCGVQETEGGPSAGNGEMKGSSSGLSQGCDNIDMLLASDERLEEFDDQENKPGEFVGDEMDEVFNFKLNEIGNKNAAGGWFVSEGEAVLLAHDDGSCSYYDIANCEEKSVYKPPLEVSPDIWRDCWVIRVPSSDGCSGKFVVAASAGNTMDSGFCSWDFYSKEVKAFQMEIGTNSINSSRTALRSLSNNIAQRRGSGMITEEPRQWWYRPCGPLIISTASSQRVVNVFDVRDGDQIMKWDVQRPVIAMEYSSPLQWRNRGKVLVAETESISLWDVNSLSPQALQSVPMSGRKISALHVSNTDAELGGGVRKRTSSSEAEGNDGVFCTSDSINILDFRQPSGVGLRISNHGVNTKSVFSRGDSIFLGCTRTSSMLKKQSSSFIQQFSLRKQGLFNTYTLPESNAHSHHAAISQVWGNSDLVMGVSGLGLHVFDAVKDDALRIINMDYSSPQNVREVIGPDDLYWPSFDYLGSRALLISRDRPAMWRHLIVR